MYQRTPSVTAPVNSCVPFTADSVGRECLMNVLQKAIKLGMGPRQESKFKEISV